MTTLLRTRPARKPPVARRPAALDWPTTPEIDGDTWSTGPDPADDQWHAEQSDSYHHDGPTPAEVLDDGPEPDWDALAEEAMAQDRYARGVVLA